MSGPVPRRLDFFVVGAQKAATTALSAKLANHPDICCSTPKELHIFDKESHDWNKPALLEVSANFQGCGTELLWGEATPIYMYWPKSIERLAEYNPDAKIIVSLRQPAYRALSHWKMEVFRGNDDYSFARAISDAGRARVNPVHRIYSYVERGFYAQQIARILEYFPRQNVYFCKMEELYQNESATLSSIFSFLGVTAHSTEGGTQYVVSVDSSEVIFDEKGEIEYLSALYQEDICETARLTGLSLGTWIDGSYDETYLQRPHQRRDAMTLQAEVMQ